MGVIMKNRFVSYVRVSTQRQDYGLDSQRKAINDYVKRVGGEIIKEFCEKISGSKNNRAGLQSALNHCRVTGSILIVGKLDRLSRSASFIMDLQNTDIDFVCADNPNINKMTISILAVVAENEREMISKRTKEGLEIAKSRGVKLGVKGRENLLKYIGENKEHYKLGQSAWMKKSKTVSEGYREIIGSIMNDGISSYNGISKELMNRGIKSSRGGDKWNNVSVKRLMNRLEITP
jgi:DNA invertase Pin-like site-specific DNA recombinase